MAATSPSRLLGRAISALAIILVSVSLTVAASAASRSTFTKKGVIFGSKTSQEECVPAETSVWVVVDREGDCVRFFHAGLESLNNVVHVWFHYDVMTQNTDGTVAGVPDWYAKTANERNLQAIAKRNFANDGLPYIRLSRPGTYGSSGNHKHRRRPREAKIVNAALDEIKVRYSIDRFALSGQSGGGHVVAHLLTLRDDIRCAVMTSAALAVRMRNRDKGWNRDITGYSDFFDPIKHVDAIKQDDDRRVFVVGDPRDTNVPFFTQKAYAEEAKSAGHRVVLLEGKAAAPSTHDLTTAGFLVTSWCLKGWSAARIQGALKRRANRN
jgi:hypothetical protein